MNSNILYCIILLCASSAYCVAERDVGLQCLAVLKAGTAMEINGIICNYKTSLPEVQGQSFRSMAGIW